MIFIISCLQLRESQLTVKNVFCGSSNIKTTRSPNILYDIKLCSFTLELISIIARLNGEDIDKKSINAMDLFQPCICLYLNRVLLTHHFKYWVEIIFKIIVTGKVKYLHSSFHIFIRCCRLLMHQFIVDYWCTSFK